MSRKLDKPLRQFLYHLLLRLIRISDVELKIRSFSNHTGRIFSLYVFKINNGVDIRLL